MSAEWMWWGRQRGDTRLHAVAPCDIAPAAERGFTEALCGQQLPVGIKLISEPDDGPVCGACHLGATADLGSSQFPALAPFIPPATGEAAAASEVEATDADDVVDRSRPDHAPCTLRCAVPADRVIGNVNHTVIFPKESRSPPE